MTYLHGVMERGLKGQKLHCHYRVYFKNAMRLQGLQAIFGKAMKASPTQHPEAVERYIQKHDQTYLAGTWKFGVMPCDQARAFPAIVQALREGKSDGEILTQYPVSLPYLNIMAKARIALLPKPLIPASVTQVEETPYPYQAEVKALIKGLPVARRWIWVWSTETGTGKTALGEWILNKAPGIAVTDMRSTVFKYNPVKHRALIADVPHEGVITQEMMSLWEMLSDQRTLSSDKYESTDKVVVAHMVIITNEAPHPFHLNVSKRILAIHAESF